MDVIRGRVLIAGTAEGDVLRLESPVSFWGGVDPGSGRLTDPAGPAYGQSVAGRVLVLAATRGSSSSSAILLELLAAGHAPAALVMAEADAILTVGVLVAGEMGWPTIPVLELPRAEQHMLVSCRRVRVGVDGSIIQSG